MSGDRAVLRAFNDDGIEAFRAELAGVRNGQTDDPSRELLYDPRLTSPWKPEVKVTPRRFVQRRDAADYFHDVLSEIPAESLRKSAGLWTWLSLYYFDEICPKSSSGRTVRNDYTYIYMPEESHYFYRHLLFVAWYLQHLAPTHNRLFLEMPIHRLDKFTEGVTKRLYLTRIPCLFEVLDRLYWDEHTGRPRKGVVSPGKVTAGDLVHRFPVRIRQLEKTYDLQSLDADQLMRLLGEEFQQLAAETTRAAAK